MKKNVIAFDGNSLIGLMEIPLFSLLASLFVRAPCRSVPSRHSACHPANPAHSAAGASSASMPRFPLTIEGVGENHFGKTCKANYKENLKPHRLWWQGFPNRPSPETRILHIFVN